ncbi:MAG: hypothetical protein HYV95_04985 [Opitutae bacterium]|nr:hypothetical protein [Opitutae bacterium]
MSAIPPQPEAPWRAGLDCARALAVPGLALFATACGVVFAYYQVPAARGALEQLAEWRMRGGFAYSAGSTALLAGAIPFLYLHFDPATRAKHPWPHLAFFTLFWGYKGIEIDLLYRLQDRLFGSCVCLGPVAEKMLVDQFIYNPLFAAPYGVLLYACKDAGWRWAPARADLRAGRWYYRRVLPVMIAVWAVWIPTVCCVYALPLALQLPLNSVVNCFWVILFSHLTVRPNQR